MTAACVSCVATTRSFVVLFGTIGDYGTSLSEGVLLEWQQWLAILKQYGPFVGLLLGFIYWQARWINKLLDRHERVSKAEIERMDRQMTKLLDHVLGPQPSSSASPTIAELKAEGNKSAPGTTRELPDSSKKKDGDK